MSRAEPWSVLEPQGADEQGRSLEDRHPSQGLDYGTQLILLPPWLETPVASQKKGGWGLSFGEAGGWQVCPQDLTHLARKREATARCTNHSRCRHLEPAMGDSSVCCELFVDLAPLGEG